MDFKTLFLQNLPYMIAGASVLLAVSKSKYKDMLRVDKDILNMWGLALTIGFVFKLLLVTMIRHLQFETFGHFLHMDNASLRNIGQLPYFSFLTVFWEDALHTLPLAMLDRMRENRNWIKWIRYPLMILLMANFGLGHLYQGIWVAIQMCFYVPLVTNLGKKHGFGTVILGHMMFDFSVISLVKILLSL